MRAVDEQPQLLSHRAVFLYRRVRERFITANAIAGRHHAAPQRMRRALRLKKRVTDKW
jgi:hypothetical protein